ncbi:hypothetical protein [Frigidibacter sp. ROC022]|uniref:hypothetical protein n=1 Tax=Frigidibacter sp. ROC022 TaxID=2971796 RepID=UPI00215B6C19|nr:hypothetical protein [Frigidibacter sp. ROC022]MCR8723991.1 hypothetical protein [Frigidibacter sp. ROC022]
MSLLRTPAGRASGPMDHLIAAAGCLAVMAVLGAVLTMAASLAEPRLGAGPPVAQLWSLGAALMAVPLSALPMLLPGILSLLLARRAGAGGWAVAGLIGLTLAALRMQLAGQPATAATLGIGAAMGLVYWELLRQRCNGRLTAAS